MTEANETMLAGGRVEQAAELLRQASDDHAWRARSFAAALEHVAASRGSISPPELAALAEALRGHVDGLHQAVNAAHGLLTERPESRPAGVRRSGAAAE